MFTSTPSTTHYRYRSCKSRTQALALGDGTHSLRGIAQNGLPTSQRSFTRSCLAPSSPPHQLPSPHESVSAHRDSGELHSS